MVQKKKTKGEQKPLISNYKISFRTTKEIFFKNTKKNLYTTRRYSNFLVLRQRFVHTVFYSGFVNITKIKNFRSIEAAIKEFCKASFIEVADISEYKVDNTTASGHFGRPLNIRLIRKSFEIRRCEYMFSYKPCKFAGASIKYGRGRGTITVFKSGAYTIVGAKSIARVNEIYAKTRKILFEDPE
jgi:TATA-box binding protein (TBP) (component of TFIID and TFIIIB)